MVKKEDSIRVESKRDKNGKLFYTYIFMCRSNCGREFKAQSGHFKNATGLCYICAQKGEPYAHIIGELKKTCERKNRECSITLEQFVDLIKIPECHYCEDDLIFNKHTRDDNGKPLSRASHLDRKDNNKGYSIDNVVLCCWECNRLKSNRFTYEEFIQFKPILVKIMKDRKLNNI